MKALWLLVSLACAATLDASPAAAQGGNPAPVNYALSPPSEFQWGCFDGCACPVFSQSPLAGRFVLTFSHNDPLFAYYDVTDVRWTVPSPSGTVVIIGSGTYRRGGEVALQEELSLALSFDQGPVQQFTSGLQPVRAQFPEIYTDISVHAEFCFDSVLTVDARPSSVVAVDGSPGRPSLAVGPNPSAQVAEVAFTLPREETIDLAVFDLAGRRVRSLATNERLPAGPHVRPWDGTHDGGGMAAPGVYVVRLDTRTQRVARAVLRVR